MGERNEEDFEAAIDDFDWLGEFDDEGVEGSQGRGDRDDSTSTEKAGQESCIEDSAAAATVVAGRTNEGGDGDGGEEETEGMAAEDPRERHKAAERERRKSMRELFLSLHALLPHGQSVRKEQSAILDEVIGYIPVAASRLSKLRGNYYHQKTTRLLRTSGAPATASGSTSTSNSRRGIRQLRRYHPYSSCSSSSSTTYGHSNSDLIYSDDQSPLLLQPTEEQDRQVVEDNRHVTATEADVYRITGGNGMSAPVLSQSLPPGPQLQFHIQLQQQQDEAPDSSSTISSSTSGTSPSVSVRVRGDRVTVSLINTREPYTSSSSCSSHSLLMLSAVLDELEAHHLQLVRSTHCRDGSKLLHYSESKIAEEMEGTPTELKAKLQDLAQKLQNMRNTGNA